MRLEGPRQKPPAPYRSPLHGPSTPSREREWLRFQVQAHHPKRYWEPVAESDDRNRALLEALKRARIGKVAYRVWDRVDRKEIWQGYGPHATIDEWLKERPPGLVGQNSRDKSGIGKRGRWSYCILAAKGFFAPMMTKERAMNVLARIRRRIAARDPSPLYEGQGELVIGQLRRSPQGWEFALPGTEHVTYHYDKARDAILRAIRRRPRPNDRRAAMTVPLDLRYKLIACRAMLDGRPAKISGAKEPFALVRSLDGKLQGEWSWDAVLRICRAGGRFKANPRTHRNPVISKRMQALRPGTMRLGDAMRYGKALLDAGYVIRVWDGSGWEVVIHPNDTLATSSGKGQSGGRSYLARGAGMVKTWPITLIAYRGQQSLGWMTPDKIRPLLKQRTALANSGDEAPTFHVMHISVDGAGWSGRDITLKRKAIALAQKLQSKADKRGNRWGYRYVVYRSYPSGRSDAIYRTKSKATANWNGKGRGKMSALMNSHACANERAAHKSIVDAFMAGKHRHFGTSREMPGSRYATDGQQLKVWGHVVAEKVPGGIKIRDAGYQTLLTKNVLNTVLDRLGWSRISQMKYAWYLGSKPWEGEAVIPTGTTLTNRRSARSNGVHRRGSAVFCGPACKSGFIADRRAGAIYPAVHEVDAHGKRTGKWWTHEQFSGLSGKCAYCGKQVRKAKAKVNARFAKRNGRFRIGDLVVVTGGSGLRSGATARVVRPFDWRLEEGAYKPVPRGWIYLAYQWGGHGGKVGEKFTMPANRLRLLGADKNGPVRRNAFAATPYYQIKGKIHRWESGQPATLPKGKTLVTVYLPGVDATVFETWISGGERHWKAVRMHRHHNPLTRRESADLLWQARGHVVMAKKSRAAGMEQSASYAAGRAQGKASAVRQYGPQVARRAAKKILERQVNVNPRKLLGKRAARSAMKFA